MAHEFENIQTELVDTDIRTLSAVPLSLSLFVAAAAQGNFSLPYSRQQFSAMQDDQHTVLGPLARCCLVIASRTTQGHDIEHTLARLAQRPSYAPCAELLSRALLHQQEPEQWSPSSAPNPLPAKLLRALLHWPEQPGLLDRVLHILAQQPALSQTLCQQATAYTPQGKQLALKQSLLLLGPQRSRELLLLSHFESSLTQPYFPLRRALLQRRRLMNQLLFLLQSKYDLQLPCRIELLTYLLIYDAWRNPTWCTAAHWDNNPEAPVYSLNAWLTGARPLLPRTASRLVQYWQLDDGILPLLNNDAAACSAQSALQLAIAATSTCSEAQLESLSPALRHYELTSADYAQLAEQAQQQIGHYCPWPNRRY